MREMDTRCQWRAPQKVAGSGWGYAVPRGSPRSGGPDARTLWRGPGCRRSSLHRHRPEDTESCRGLLRVERDASQARARAV